MPYINLLVEDAINIEFFQRENSYLAQVLVGTDGENCTYFLHVMLDPVVGGDGWEMSFCIVEYDGEADTEYRYFSAKDVAHKIPKEAREPILTSLVASAQHLLTAAKPLKVLICTYDTYLPEKANLKFIILAHLFERNGFTVKHSDPYNGQSIWWMTKD